MAEIHDFDSSDVGELEAVEQQIEAEATTEPEAPATQEDDIPDEFKGLSAAELARKLKHSYKEMGRQANELGEIRKLADELIKSNLKPKEAEKEPERPVDFFEDPNEAVRRAVETNPAVREAQEAALMLKRQMAAQEFNKRHPDNAQIVADPEFQDWVGRSKVRIKLLQQADNYDVDAADELLSTFKELRNAKTRQQQEQAQATERVAREKTMQAAAVDVGGSGETTKKIYRRADLIRLQIQDRARYEAMQDEIMQAYQEGRVR